MCISIAYINHMLSLLGNLGGFMSFLSLRKDEKRLIRILKLADRDNVRMNASKDGVISISSKDVTKSESYKRDARRARELVEA